VGPAIRRRWHALVRSSRVAEVLVLNASYEPLNTCTVRRAHVLVDKQKAEVVEHGDEPLRSASASFVRPLVIRLLQYVRVPRTVKRRISRRVLFARDGWRCVYCGTASGRLTLDHVLPRSRGGDSSWENVVTACSPCNLRKGDKTPEEASLSLARPPRAPAPVLFIRLALHRVPELWAPYLPGVDAELATEAA
jgi:5-methylcytosine-specific restriction endonuclease McrA